jgi:dTDP-4-dehydrorhamnose reductase
MKTLVIGASGLVGSNVARRFRDGGADVVGTYRTRQNDEATVQVDKADEQAVSTLVARHDPDVVVDAGAFHDVDRCETARDEAWAVNAAGTHNVAAAAGDVGAHYVFLSTDYVFPGDPDRTPYAETDPVAPANYYAQSKYAGEQAAKTASTWTVLRTSVLYGVASDNFLTWALNRLRENGEVSIVDDQTGTPTYAPDIAEACFRMVRQGDTGLFHAAGPKSLTRYEFTRRIAEAYGYPPEAVKPVSTETIDQIAPRPRDSSLDSTQLYETIDYTFRDPGTALDEINS